ncbi:MAG: ATP-binding protein [Acidimicrobiaceae bacterium]|nr:ATP-binding protein [Acidimicrobiaceae bacterium]
MTGFRARARTVDMLGRQQIANSPTALSELFKNSHDAYAKNVRADFFRPRDLLVIRDDGVGMDRETFEQSWLTIATESKLGRTPTLNPSGMRERVQLGEKGIGRLAIGALGSQVLVVSKSEDRPTVAAFVSWKMFELPGIDLDDVPVGLLELDSGEPTAADVTRLKAPIKEAVERFRRMKDFKQQSQQRQLDEILKTLEYMPDDPYHAVPGLEPIGESGTVFFISPVSDDFLHELDESDTGRASLFERTLHGFTDAWFRDRASLDFSVGFVDHRRGGDFENLLQSDDFFRESDFERADHHIKGEFDEKGDFSGTVRIFNEAPTDVKIKCPSLSSKPRCGSFTLEMGVVQGWASESRLDPEEFSSMYNRLRKLGGLYVYMDGIRVQPYGRPDVDYLEIEERRTLSASYYYFSYRRMFGAVSLTSRKNSELKEKSGREGFTGGRAFSDFRRLLMNLLVELAAKFFRVDSPQGYAYEKGRERLRREDRLRKERDKRANAGRRQLKVRLASAVQSLDKTDFQKQTSEIVRELSAHLDGADRLQTAAEKIADAERELRRLTKPLEFDEPEGFAATEPMRQDMMSVERGIADVEQSYIRPALETVGKLSVAVEKRLAVLKSDEKARSEFIQEQQAEAKVQMINAKNESRDALIALRETMNTTIQNLFENFKTQLYNIPEPSVSDSHGWIQEQAEFERAVDSLTVETRRAFTRVANIIEANRLVFAADAPSPVDLAAAADAEIVELRAQADAQLEFVQLGMALAVVDHEFQATVSNIRSEVRRVGSWAKQNPQLVGLYEALRRDFDHLDSYLTLLTPMQRRLRRTKTTIRGSDISRFLNDLFRERIHTSGVKIRSSRGFQRFEITGYASTFYPVFINLVDNSLYWIQQAGSGASNSIELDARGETLVYNDSGPGIADDIADRVFDFGFTTKPGGRGLGLAIASQVLERAGWSISLGDCENGAEFLIRQRHG